jgi:hypothetical protein
MSEPTPSDFQIAHTIWTATITVGGAIVAFFTKRLVDTVDQKADLADVQDLKNTLRDYIERQERQHDGTTRRLDQIIFELGQRNGSTR